MFKFAFSKYSNCFYCLILLIIIDFDIAFSIFNKKLSADTSSKICHILSEDALKYAGSATPYEFVGNFDIEPFKFPGCIPVKLWLIVRHGSRTPSKEKLKFIKKYLPKIRHHILYNFNAGKGELPDETMEDFKDWSLVLPDDRKLLTDYGKREIYELAKRFQRRFPQLIPNVYSKLQYNFRHSISDRTKKSAYSWAIALFGARKVARFELHDSLQNRFLLKFPEYCRKWVKELKRKPERFIEHIEFTFGPEVEQLTYDVTRRLGLNETLSYDEIRSMLHTCASEYVWDGSDSPWCHIFTQNDLEIMDYEADLKSYYRDSYGHKINYKQACPMVKDMMQYLTDSSSWPPVVLSFSHSGSITKFITALKLYSEDKHLKQEIKLNRKWRGSKLDAFASNFGTVLYRCNNNEDKVLTLHQERPITLPGCPENDLCPLDILISNYNHTINNCNFDEICHVKKNNDESKVFDDDIENVEEEGLLDKILSIFE